jgi:hypothetical protein
MLKRDPVRKRGRPPAAIPTVQVTVKLSKNWVERFQKKEGGISKAIQERLSRSFAEDERRRQVGDRDIKLVTLAGQMEELAIRVRRGYGAEWYQDRGAYEAFVGAVTRLLNAQPKPRTAKTMKYEPEQAAQIIYDSYIAELKEDDPADGIPKMRTPIKKRLNPDEEHK